MERGKSVFIAGHKGMVGSAIHRLMGKEGFSTILVAPKSELDLLDQHAVQLYFEKYKPECVILAAAKVGGIQANMDNPGKFLYENLVIQNNVIHQSYLSGVEKLVFLGSSCIYPKECPQPMKEEYILTGKLEPTNEGYAIAKIAGLRMTQFYEKQYGMRGISLMPCNLYGPNDSFDLQHSHVLSALVKRFSDAAASKQSEITLWGTGLARREFMHVDDMAAATLYMMEHYHSSEFINIGWGDDISIKELAEMIAAKVGFEGQIKWDASKPNGMLKKCMDVTRMKAIGFVPKISLSEGVDQLIDIYKSQKKFTT
jgi:GDP-L-fucose synthase